MARKDTGALMTFPPDSGIANLPVELFANIEKFLYETAWDKINRKGSPAWCQSCESASLKCKSCGKCHVDDFDVYHGNSDDCSSFVYNTKYGEVSQFLPIGAAAELIATERFSSFKRSPTCTGLPIGK